MIVKIDVDGVIRNINETMCRMYNQLFNENLTVDDIHFYEVEKVFTKFKEEKGINAAEYFFEISSREVFLESNPYDGVKEAIQKLMDNGHKVIIVTWQHTLMNKINTLFFLEMNNIPYDDICFTRDKWMIQGDWLIDDNPEFINDERDKSKKIMIKMPYNKKATTKFVLKTNNLKEAVDVILDNQEVLLELKDVPTINENKHKES